MEKRNSDFEDLCRTIKCLVIARKERTTIETLKKDFRDNEGRDIPFSQYGFSSLRSFLRSLTEYINLITINGIDYVTHVENEKTAHISKLVSEQRSSGTKSKHSKRGRGCRGFQPSRHFPVGGSTRCLMSANELKQILNMVKHHPQGISKRQLLEFIHHRNHYSQITLSDLDSQLRELTHEIVIRDHLVFPRMINHPRQSSTFSFVPTQVSQMQHRSNSVSRNAISVPAGFDEETKLMSDDDFLFEIVHAKDESNVRQDSPDIPKMQSPKDEKYLNHNHSEKVNEANGFENDENGFINSNLVNERTRIRLEKLIEKHEDGIWCADLPKLYEQEYKISLNYMDMGFDSVREIAAYLKDIFVLEQPKEHGDFKMYHAKTHEKLIKDPPAKKKTTASLYDVYDYCDEKQTAVPDKLSEDTQLKLFPPDVLNNNETVGQVEVTELKDGEKVILSEVFDPSFFWIRQFKRQGLFDTLMQNLAEFYDKKCKSYIIPPIILEKGLQVACQYKNIWHRGIVKSIRPNNFACILFYDYGTVKLIQTNELFFLHRRFSNIPALAVPCGMYNLQPLDEHRWVKWVNDEFLRMTLNQCFSIKLMSVDEETNSAMVYLYNEQFHVHKRMLENALAAESSVISKVDIENLELYEEEQLINRDCSGPLIMALVRKAKNSLSHDTPQTTEKAPLISPSSFVNDKEKIEDTFTNLADRINHSNFVDNDDDQLVLLEFLYKQNTLLLEAIEKLKCRSKNKSHTSSNEEARNVRHNLQAYFETSSPENLISNCSAVENLIPNHNHARSSTPNHSYESHFSFNNSSNPFRDVNANISKEDLRIKFDQYINNIIQVNGTTNDIKVEQNVNSSVPAETESKMHFQECNGIHDAAVNNKKALQQCNETSEIVEDQQNCQLLNGIDAIEDNEKELKQSNERDIAIDHQKELPQCNGIDMIAKKKKVEQYNASDNVDINKKKEEKLCVNDKINVDKQEFQESKTVDQVVNGVQAKQQQQLIKVNENTPNSKEKEKSKSLKNKNTSNKSDAKIIEKGVNKVLPETKEKKMPVEEIESVIAVELSSITDATIHIIDIDNSGWVIIFDFIRLFLGLPVDEFLREIKTMNVSIENKVISAENYPLIFKQMKRLRNHTEDNCNTLTLISLRSILYVLVNMRIINANDLKKNESFGTVQENLTIEQMVIKDYKLLIASYKALKKKLKKAK